MARLDGGATALQQKLQQQHVVHQYARSSERVVRLQADRNGHFEVEAYINERPLRMLADTGGTRVVLTYED